MSTPQPWRFPFARVLRVIDGDTFDAEIELGFHSRTTQRFRLRDYNAPELRGDEHRFGVVARTQLELMIAGRNVELETWRTDSFGRWLADVVVRGPEGDPIDVVRALVADGYGVPWDGRPPRPFPWLAPDATYPLGARD